MLIHTHSEPQAPERVVVIGARGFIGATLVAQLTKAGVPTLGLTSADFDLTATDAAERLAGRLRPGDAVVMLAALTPDKGRDRATFQRNLAMVDQVCGALERVPPAHLVYLSSDAVYHPALSHVSEATSASPDDLYGTMHRAREVLMASATRAPVAILRLTLTYGASDTHNSYGPNRLRRMAHQDGRITLFGQGEETRDHVSVDDAAALLRLVLGHRSSGLLNIATGSSVDFDTLARKVAALFPQPIEVVHTPRANPVTHRHYDITNLRKAFPTFRFTPLDQGLAQAHREMIGLS